MKTVLNAKLIQPTKLTSTSGILTHTPATDLDEPVDVYSAWIDACEDVNQQRRMKAAQKSRESRDDSRSPPPQSYSEDRLDPFDEDDDDDDY
ncbi:hypothetical protein PS6_010898 [Mucor atramentarius]